MKSVVCIGDIAVDSYVNMSCRYVGGISFNIAWNLTQCGVGAHVVSAVGEDDDGAAVLRALSERHFPTKGIAIRKGATAEQRVIVNPNGERIFDGYRTGVLSTICLDDLLLAPLAHFNALHIPLSDGLEDLFDVVARDVTGITKIADLSIDGPNSAGLRASVERYLPYFDLLCIGGRSDDVEYIEELAGSFPHKTIVLTLGNQGAVCFHGGTSYQQAAMPVSRVVDTTGCGDGFQGAFIASWLATGGSIPEALHAGVAQGAKVASLFGATECRIETRLNSGAQ